MSNFSLPTDPDYPTSHNDMFAIIAGVFRNMAGSAWHSDTWPMQLLQEIQAVLAKQEPNAISKVARIIRNRAPAPSPV